MKPSRKIIAFAIIALGILGAVYISKYLKDNPKAFANLPFAKKTEQNVLTYDTNAPKTNSIENLDSDGDGLKDWEELLWGTDSHKKDTDGDGTSDGDEVKAGRDPNKKGPDDSLSSFATNSTKKDNIPSKPLTPSDVFSQELFSKYMALKSAGTLDDASQQELVNQMVSEAGKTFTYRQYDRSGLSVFSDTQKNEVRFYASSFATLQLNFLLELQKNSGAIAKDAGILSKLYRNLADSMYELKVPQPISTEHLKIVNNFSTASSVYDALKNAESDPLTAAIAISAHKSIEQSQIDTLKTIAEYLRKNDIIFTEGEDGNFWNNF